MLDDLNVIEIGQVLAGPYAGAILADLGATVIKIEKPDGGDDGRRMGKPFLDDDSLTFHEFNRGKRSVVLDLKSADGIGALHALADRSDVLIHNLRPDVPETLGIDPEHFCERHPRLIYCEMSGFGQHGPMRLDPAFEPLVQAISGMITINGDPAGPPSRLPISAVDMGTGMWTVIGLLAALRRREATGRGCVVRTSLFATALGWLSQRINTLVNEGVELPREAMSGHSGLVPYQSFSAADGDVFICVGNDRLFSKLCSTLGHPEWIVDPAFATNRARLTNREHLVPMIAAILSEQSRDYWCAHLGAAGVPCAPVNTLPEALALEQFTASEMLSPPLGNGAMQIVGIPLSFDGVHRHPQGIAPKLGADNALLISPATRR
jgi:crotonobetainyl-CoA:carnitine CoA-transferase CaiB-like acyl-CoA transferase